MSFKVIIDMVLSVLRNDKKKGESEASAFKGDHLIYPLEDKQFLGYPEYLEISRNEF